MRGTSRGPRASAGPARGRRNERASELSVRACECPRRCVYNSPTLPIRARTPLFAVESPFLSLCLSLLSIYLYSFLIRAACRGLTPFARGPHRRNTRGPVPRMGAPRRASGPPSWQTEDALHLFHALLSSASFCSLRGTTSATSTYNDVVLRDTRRVSLCYTQDDISFALPSRLSTGWLKTNIKRSVSTLRDSRSHYDP